MDWKNSTLTSPGTSASNLTYPYYHIRVIVVAFQCALHVRCTRHAITKSDYHCLHVSVCLSQRTIRPHHMDLRKSDTEDYN